MPASDTQTMELLPPWTMVGKPILVRDAASESPSISSPSRNLIVTFITYEYGSPVHRLISRGQAAFMLAFPLSHGEYKHTCNNAANKPSQACPHAADGGSGSRRCLWSWDRGGTGECSSQGLPACHPSGRQDPTGGPGDRGRGQPAQGTDPGGSVQPPPWRRPPRGLLPGQPFGKDQRRRPGGDRRRGAGGDAP